jgi:hypothetical protein
MWLDTLDQRASRFRQSRPLRQYHPSAFIQSVIAHFFLSAKFSSRDDLNETLRPYINQIISINSKAFSIVQDAWKKSIETTTTRKTNMALLKDLVRVVSGYIPILDGLDECSRINEGGEGLESMPGSLKFLCQAVSESMTKTLVVSRDESGICQATIGNPH